MGARRSLDDTLESEISIMSEIIVDLSLTAGLMPKVVRVGADEPL
jgi:hypothetical protein